MMVAAGILINMRIIILIQTMIILVGAYYVYTLSSISDTKVESDSIISVEVVQPEVVTGTDEPESLLVPPAEQVPVSRGNDAGMEYPIPDVEFQAQ